MNLHPINAAVLHMLLDINSVFVCVYAFVFVCVCGLHLTINPRPSVIQSHCNVIQKLGSIHYCVIIASWLYIGHWIIRP